MIDKNNLLKKLGLQDDPAIRKKEKKAPGIINDMSSASYLRQSSSLINDALKSGYDVLQMANGDIVTTGTKIVVTRYKWDQTKGKLVKQKAEAQASAKKESANNAEQETQNKETEDA